ncbi:MAG: 3-dehydroquinate synthase [Deltaproteobacteria bacterium]|nr:3-dehydroquinate synthase [Deltaproteobacteria bacterium]
MSTIKVELALSPYMPGDRSYPITVERGLLDSVGRRMREAGLGGRCAVITNPYVGSLYSKRLLDSLRGAGLDPVTIEMPDGEEYKTLSSVSLVYDRLLKERFERDSTIVALGGGVVGDMAGFVAATFLRGVPYVQVPTTLLAQVDSSVGGKTGVNHPLGKNLIGAFYQPKAVFIDPDVLNTLEKREFISGLGEVVKYGVIRDGEFFSFLEKNRDRLLSLKDEITRAIERACAIKAEVVSMDERETGLRSILNLGHTFGHAIEAITGYTKFKHGEAVSIGMAMAAELSFFLGLTGKDAVRRIKDLLSGFGLPVSFRGISPPDFIETMRFDKKVKEGKIRFVLVEDIGKVILKDVDEGKLKGFLSGESFL